MDASSRPRTGVRVVEAGTEHQALDLGQADHWYIVVTSSGTPILRIEFPSPGEGGGDLAGLLISRRVDAVLWRRRLTAELRAAFGVRPAEHAVRPTVSVLVCTHRRPQHLPLLLAALERLDPAPDEVIIVDNDPGDADCRELVERSGARYVREDRRGQDNARNAGLAVASGDVVAFTDDDCVPAPGWLAHVAENFADPLVGASTGPGFPWALDTPAQEHIERQGGFMRGLDRRVLDWRLLSPVHAGAAGAGANMMVRRSALAGLDAVWPPELGPGTPTESGDDTYVLSRFLAAGYRIVYDPRQWFRHQHRADWPALRRAVSGYGVGSMCMLLKSLTENGETEAPRGLSWIVRRYLRTLCRRLLGDADRIEARITADYVRGAAAGPARLRASRRAHAAQGGRPAGLELPPPRAAFSTTRPGKPARRVDLSVVVALEAGVDPSPCLLALRAGTGAPQEVITVGPATERPELADRHVACGASDGPAARWNAGARTAAASAALFLRASMIPARGLVAAHAHHHACGSDLVVGGAYALPADESLSSSWAALARPADGFQAPALAPGPGPVQEGNVSVGADALAALGGFRDGPDPTGDLLRLAAGSGRTVTYDATAGVAVPVRATVDDLGPDGTAARALLPVLEGLHQRGLWASVVRRGAPPRAPEIPLAPRTAVLDLAAPVLAPPCAEPPDRLEIVAGSRPLAAVEVADRPGPAVLADRVAALLDADPASWDRLAVARGWAHGSPPAELPGGVAVLAAEAGASLAAAALPLPGLGADGLLRHVRAAARELAEQVEWLVVVAPELRAERALIDDLAPVLSASRVGCVHGSRTEGPLGAALTLSAELAPESLRGSPVDYVLVRAAVAAGLSDADVDRAGADPRAALLWIAGRAADRGWLLGRLDARGLSPLSAGALAARAADHRAALGWWLGARLREASPGRSRRAAGGSAAAELLGSVRGREEPVLPLVRGLTSALRRVDTPRVRTQAR